MTLQVPYNQFAETVRRVLAIKEVYVTRQGTSSLVTACASSAQTIVAALTPHAVDRIKKELSAEGLKIYDGAWSAEGLCDLGAAAPTEAYVAAVAYISQDGRPGLWIDAYDSSPTPAQVLKTMYDEFRGTGETADVSFEEFVRLANANVVLVNPSQIRGYLQEKVAKVLTD